MTAAIVTGKLLDSNLARKAPNLGISLTKDHGSSTPNFLAESARPEVTSHLLFPHSS
jgi:hypothetical protein